MRLPFRLSHAQAFALRFFGLLAGASVVLWWVEIPKRLGTFQNVLAALASTLAGLTGGATTVTGDRIHAGPYIIEINYECTGVYVLLILLVFLLAYPAVWWYRIAGIAVGFVALTAVNIFRIAVLLRVAEIEPDLFGYFHEYVWQGVFLVLVIAYAMSWVQRIPRLA